MDEEGEGDRWGIGTGRHGTGHRTMLVTNALQMGTRPGVRSRPGHLIYISR